MRNDAQVCGGDLLESFTVIKEDGEPLWLPEDQHIILAQNGVACLEREGVNLAAVIEQHDILRKNCANSEFLLRYFVR
jgi:nicotinamide mononucleotide adenylyltransferase